MSVERQQIVRAFHKQRDVIAHTAEDYSYASLEQLTEAQDLFSFLRAQFNAETKSTCTNPKSARMGFHKSLALQQGKQKIMRNLKRTLDALRKDSEMSFETSASGRKVSMDADGALWAEHGDRRERLTAGDIFLDGDWGIDYNLDGSVPIAIRKRYVLERAKMRLRELFDAQLNKLGLHSGMRVRMRALLSGHSPVREGNLNTHMTGVAAEHIARGFLARAAYSLFGSRNLFQVIPTDEFGDIVEKIDFVIRKSDASFARGAEVHADMKRLAIGIQFTIVVKHHKKERNIQTAKRRGLGHIDDLILLRLPGVWAADAYEKWLEAGKPSGGPERFLALEQKQAIFRGALQRLLSDEDVEEGLRRLEAPVR